MAKTKDREASVEPSGETKGGEKTKDAAAEHKEARRRYGELVHTDIAGWPEKKIVEHRKKCREALAAKQPTANS